jgi:16S rRNA (uracil1498-N3)-methyltransferase
MRGGDGLVLFDGGGSEWLATLGAVEGGEVVVRLLEERSPSTEPAARVTLCQGLLKTNRFEFVIQKATELGVHAVQPVVTRRSVAEPPSGQRILRWSRIAREAAEQSGRLRVPEVLAAASLEVAAAGSDAPAIALWEGERTVSLREALMGASGGGKDGLRLFVGPEGGFEAGEAEVLKASGATLATLGARILRSETAGVAAVTVAMYELGELGGGAG